MPWRSWHCGTRVGDAGRNFEKYAPEPFVAADGREQFTVLGSSDGPPQNNTFKANPEKYAPQYGGHCAWCVSEACICGRPANGQFEILDGRLYLFPDGNKGRSSGTKNAWWTTGGGPPKRIPNSDRFWPELKARLEAQGDASKGPTPISGPGGGMDAIR